MQVSGKVVKVTKVKQITDTYKNCEVWIETTDQYPQTISVQVSQDKADQVQALNVGEEVTFDINLRGRTWTNKEGVEKCFNTIEGWKWTKVGESNPDNNGDLSVDPNTGEVYDDDLPFS